MRHAIRRSAIAIGVFGAIVIALAFLVWQRPGGFLPEDDQGYMLMVAQLPPGASLQRTEQVLEQIRAVVQKQPEVESMLAITGLNLLAQVNTPYTGSGFIPLKPWSKRPGQAAARRRALIDRLYKLLGPLKEANVVFVAPPAIPGIGQAGGFEFILADTSGGSLENFTTEIDDFLAQANKRKELARVSTQFNNHVPEIEYVDRSRPGARARNSDLGHLRRPADLPWRQLHQRLQSVRANVPRHRGGRGLRADTARCGEHSVRAHGGGRHGAAVVAGVDQADARSGLHRALQRVPGRHDQRRAGAGYSQGDAINAMESLAKALPGNLTYYWTGSVFQQQRAGSQAPYIFAMALVFVFLVLAAQYESWIVPFAVILCIPFAVFGAFLGSVDAQHGQRHLCAGRVWSC